MSVATGKGIFRQSAVLTSKSKLICLWEEFVKHKTSYLFLAPYDFLALHILIYWRLLDLSVGRIIYGCF